MRLRYNFRVYPTLTQREALARAFGTIAPPRFRSRKDRRQAIRFTKNSRFTVLGNGRLRLPKVGDLEVRSNNRKKAVVKVARAHARVADTRRDWQHKLSTAIIRDNQAVHVEDLAVAGLVRTRLAKPVYDAGWSQFVGMLEYKATRYGRTFGKIDRFAPTSQTCSTCGRIDGPKPLKIRSWTCPCGAVHDRDVNAAKNILAAGQADRLNDRGAHIRPAPVPAAREEAVTHPHATCSTRSVEGISVL